MRSTRFRYIVLFVLCAGLILTATVPTLASRQEATPEQMTLPYASDVTLKKGKDVDVVLANCARCHTFKPIVTHDGFSAGTWASEVDKMRNVYGADISDADAAKIVTYLQTYYSGEPASASNMLVYGSNAPGATPGASPASSPVASPAVLPSD
ncbi:MAG: c-type cytochrome [Thermomicrobiales bacterium]